MRDCPKHCNIFNCSVEAFVQYLGLTYFENSSAWRFEFCFPQIRHFLAVKPTIFERIYVLRYHTCKRHWKDLVLIQSSLVIMLNLNLVKLKSFSPGVAVQNFLWLTGNSSWQTPRRSKTHLRFWLSAGMENGFARLSCVPPRRYETS